MKGNTTNTVLILILVVLVAFGVWYFAYRPAGQASDGPSLNIELDGGESGSGTSGSSN